LLVTVGDHPERLRSDAAFASLCGVSPLPASSGKTNRHRLNRGGNRQANATLHRIVVVRLRWHEQTKAYAARRWKKGAAKPRSCVVSNDSLHGRCSIHFLAAPR
jgi:transposase